MHSKLAHRGTNPKMKVRVSFLWAATAVLLASIPVFSESMQQPQAGEQPQNPPSTTQGATLPSQPEQQPQGAAPLRVMVGKSLLINTTERLKRISVTDPAIASAVVITPTQILVHGRTPGEI